MQEWASEDVGAQVGSWWGGGARKLKTYFYADGPSS